VREEKGGLKSPAFEAKKWGFLKLNGLTSRKRYTQKVWK
jgi:hypothetical protein